MSRHDKITLAVLAAYLAVALLTFGYVYKRELYEIRWHDRSMGAFMSGIGWPVYWAGYGALELFDTPRLQNNPDGKAHD